MEQKKSKDIIGMMHKCIILNLDKCGDIQDKKVHWKIQIQWKEKVLCMNYSQLLQFLIRQMSITQNATVIYDVEFHAGNNIFMGNHE